MTHAAVHPPGDAVGGVGPSPFRALLRVPPGAADLSARGVVPADPARARVLEGVARHFLSGCNAMYEGRPFAALDTALADAEPARRGFVVEGAAMGAVIRDALSLRGGHLATLQGLHGARHDYLIAVGAGWGVARTPWRAARVRATLDPLLDSLACDGRGFHDLYFNPMRASTGAIAWGRGDLARAYDAGLGRAIWFVASGHPPRVHEILDRFDPARRPDLLAGLGLAMAYAGPATAADWAALRARHGALWRHVGQGVCFAAEAMRKAGARPATLEIACTTALGLSVDAAADIAATTRPEAPPGRAAAAGAFQRWRAEIRRRLPAAAAETVGAVA